MSDSEARRWTAATRRRPPLLLTLAAALVACLALLPLAYLLIRAGGGGDAWRVLTRHGTAVLLWKTGALVAAVSATAAVVGVTLAWLVTRTDMPGRRVLGVLAALPLVIPSYVAALALLGAFGPRGLLQKLLAGPFGVERIPEIYGFPGALAALTLSTYPYVFLLAAAALSRLDPALEEAARGLGRSRPATFFSVTLPLLRPSVVAGTLLVALYALSDFGAVSLMQYDALTRAIYLQYRALFDRDPAAVLALVLVALTAVVLLLELKARRGGRYHSLGPGTRRPVAPVALGSWRWPAVGFCLAIVTAFLLVPLSVLGYWLARAVSSGEDLGFAWAPLRNSVLVALAAAGAATLASLPLVLLARRHPTRWTHTLEQVGYTANALPGIVVALALVFFAARYGGPIYQTLGLLVFAYVVRFLPQALAGTGSALAAVSPRLEEAARGLGRSRLQVLAGVTLPLARSGLLAGAALVFLSTMKELPATLLLRPIGLETLATEAWKFTSVGAYSQAALPALLLVVASAPVVWALTTRPAVTTTEPAAAATG